MALIAPARADLAAYRKSISEPLASVVANLAAIVGKKLTAYIASVKDTRTVDAWASGSDSGRKLDEARLRLAYQIALMLSESDHPRVVQSWFLGLNPQLDDRSPASLLRSGDVDTDGKLVVNAARAFLAGG